MDTQTKIFLGLGSNLGDRTSLLKEACQDLQNLPLGLFQASSIYESAPHQGAQQPLYYNQVVSGWTFLAPDDLLRTCHAIEKKLGRVRKKRWESRLIDIDILYYGDLILDSEKLNIPHRDLANRGFVLLPMAELDLEHIDPRACETVGVLLQRWKTHTSEPMPACLKSD